MAYAAARHIEVVPEIELPGHCCSALASYPHLGCEQALLWLVAHVLATVCCQPLLNRMVQFRHGFAKCLASSPGFIDAVVINATHRHGAN